MAVYNDFIWSNSLRDKGNNIVEFKKINIIYGRNYSGKTTLSRIIRSLETGVISDKYENPEFQVAFENNHIASSNLLNSHRQIIRVFNEDFIKENLRFIVNDEDPIKSFAVLGEDNAKLEEEILKLEVELGSRDQKTGLHWEQAGYEVNYKNVSGRYNTKCNALEEKLKDKANKKGTGIKHNTIYGDANYNVTKINSDIASILSASFSPLTDEMLLHNIELLKEITKDDIDKHHPIKLDLTNISHKAKELIECKIEMSEPIQELLNDTILSTWVKNGREHHKDKRSHCAFCGNELPPSLWLKLDKHFNEQSEALLKNINNLLLYIDNEVESTSNIRNIDHSKFYYNYHAELKALQTDLELQIKNYLEALNTITSQLNNRKDNIFTALEYDKPNSVEDKIFHIYDEYEKIRLESNSFTKSLSKKQVLAKSELRLNEVYKFITDIKYEDEKKAIKLLNTELFNAKKTSQSCLDIIIDKEVSIKELKAKLKDESKGAERVNYYLNNYFGHQSLSLRAVEQSFDGGKELRFEIIRNGKKAFHLSEGECSLLAFCYFMAKLEDVETKGMQPIIWIDDPISSLDANHIFFVYSLINSAIVSSENYEDAGEIKKRDRYKQLFISTHNLDFLKYLKRLPDASNNKLSQYFIINRSEKGSNLSLMPRYLKDYVTEFNFLFHQVYKCANAQVESDENHDCYYNFGNNARKFLEAFLYFKYPNARDKDDKLLRFFGEDTLATSLTDRINNEYSHLAGVFERSTSPIDVPEMKTTAIFILRKIKEKDPEQYAALLDSIGVAEEATMPEIVNEIIVDITP